MATRCMFDRREKLQPFTEKIPTCVDAGLTETIIDSGEIRSQKFEFVGEIFEEESKEIETKERSTWLRIRSLASVC